MWEAMEQWGWVKAFNVSPWMYSAVMVVHYLAFFWCIGSIAVVDLRIMGVAARRRNPVQLADQLFPFAWTGLALAILTGFVLFMPQAGEWAPDPIFHVKLAMLALAVAFAVIVQRSVPKWSKAPEVLQPKKMPLVSLLLWILTILCGSLVILFGLLMLTPAVGDWAHNPLFLEFTLFSLVLAFALIVQESVPAWANAAEIPRAAKIIALLSVLLLILTIIWGSEIPSMEGLG
jgi:hypothetical protein